MHHTSRHSWPRVAKRNKLGNAWVFVQQIFGPGLVYQWALQKPKHFLTCSCLHPLLKPPNKLKRETVEVWLNSDISSKAWISLLRVPKRIFEIYGYHALFIPVHYLDEAKPTVTLLCTLKRPQVSLIPCTKPTSWKNTVNPAFWALLLPQCHCIRISLLDFSFSSKNFKLQIRPAFQKLFLKEAFEFGLNAHHL